MTNTASHTATTTPQEGPMSSTSTRGTVYAIAASGPGALSGHAVDCARCGLHISTSLSARMAEIDYSAHLAWHAKTGR